MEYNYKFVLAFEKIFGKVQDKTDLINYYDKCLHREITFVMCIHTVNYAKNNYDDDYINEMYNYIYKYQDDNTSIIDMIKIIDLINNT